MTSTLPTLVEKIDGMEVAVANHQATLGKPDPSDDGYGSYQLTVDTWSGGTRTASSVDGAFSGQDIRKAKDYKYELSDPYGHKMTN